MSYNLPLNVVEQLLYNVTLLNECNCFVLLKLNSNDIILNDEIIKKALFYMYTRHPFLRAKIVRDSETFKTSFTIPVDYEYNESQMKYEFLQYTDSSLYLREIEEFAVKFFHENDLLWRMMLIKLNDINTYVIVFSFVLVVTDGMNLCTLGIEFINILNSILSNNECNEMVHKLDLIDDMLISIDKHNLFTDYEKAQLKFKNRSNDIKYLLDPFFGNLNDSGFKINLLTIDYDLSQRIFKIAKEKNIKLTGFLTTLIIYSLRLLYKENNLKIQDDFCIRIPASLRIRTKPEIDFSGMRYLTLPERINLFYSKNDLPRNIWNDSIYANKILNEKFKMTDDKPIFHALFNLDYYEDSNKMMFMLKDNLDELRKFSNLHHDCEIVLSNLGQYVQQRKKCANGPLIIDELHFGDTTFSNPSIYSTLMFHTSTWNNKLMIQLSSNRRTIDSKYTDRLMNILNELLKNSIKD